MFLNAIDYICSVLQITVRRAMLNIVKQTTMDQMSIKHFHVYKPCVSINTCWMVYSVLLACAVMSFAKVLWLINLSPRNSITIFCWNSSILLHWSHLKRRDMFYVKSLRLQFARIQIIFNVYVSDEGEVLYPPDEVCIENFGLSADAKISHTY